MYAGTARGTRGMARSGRFWDSFEKVLHGCLPSMRKPEEAPINEFYGVDGGLVTSWPREEVSALRILHGYTVSSDTILLHY